MERAVQVALWSVPARLGDVAANVDTVTAALAEGDDLVVYPELFLTGYNIGDDVQRLALRDEDAAIATLRDACREHGVHLIVGAPHAPRPGLTYNAALCIDDMGSTVWLHKRALATFTTFREALFFGHGGPQAVWRTRLGAIGVHVCYDLYFPEFQKRQVLEGAELLINISASPSSSRRFFEALLPARAIENAVFAAYSNNVGAQDGIVFWGGSRAYGPRGAPLGALPAYEAGCLRVDVDFADLAAAREFRPTIRDSEPEATAVVERMQEAGQAPR